MIVLILIVIVFLAFVLLIMTKPFPVDAFPGPATNFFLGNLLQLGKSPHIQLADWSKKYGGLMKIKLFRSPLLVISNVKYARLALVEKNAEFAAKPNSFRIHLASFNKSGILWAAPGSEHLRRKKLLADYFGEYGMTRIESIMHSAIDSLIERLLQEQDRVCDIKDMIFRCTVDIFTMLLMEDTVSENDIQSLKLIMNKTANGLACDLKGNLLDTFPILQHFGNNSFKDLNEALKIKTSLIDKWFKNPQENGLIGFMKNMTYDNQFKYRIDSKNSKEAVAWDFITQGCLKTAATLTSLIYILTQKSEIQYKKEKSTDCDSA